MTGRTDYNGKPLIVLEPDGKYPFQFGVAKAKMILANLEDIRAFVADCERKAAPVAPQNVNAGGGR